MFSNQIIIAIGCLILFVNQIQSYRILFMCPPHVKSHHNLCRAATDILAESGHDVTFINAFPSNNSKYREIGLDMSRLKAAFPPVIKAANFSRLAAFKSMKIWLPLIPELVFANEEVQTMINDKSEKFDLYILEYYMNENLLGFGVKYNCPTLILSSVSMMPQIAKMTQNPLSIATVPSILSKFSSRMTLWQRTVNAVMAIYAEIMSLVLTNPIHKSAYEKYFPEESKRVPFEDLSSIVSGVLSNSHPSIGIPRPLLPNSVDIGGYHVTNPEPLPEDLQTIMDSSKYGVIYFSLGSMAESKDFSDDLKKSILKVFGSLKQTVLWKFEEDLKNIPKNVIIRKWMPQTSILAHPNMDLFISHGGLLSCIEATHFGVPMIMIPIFGDQHHNAMVYSERGQGLLLQHDNLTETSFRWALKEMIFNNKYKKITKEIHQIYHDRPVKPRDLLVHHVEHVIRTRGAAYLSPPYLPRYSLLLLDVMAVILIPLGLILFLFVYTCCQCCKKSAPSVEKNKRE